MNWRWQVSIPAVGSVALLTVSFFSYRESLMPQAQSPNRLTPHWEVGQKWRVEYLRNIPSTEMKSVGQIPPPQRAVWQYEVTRMDPHQGGLVVLSLREEGGEGKFEMSLDSGDRTLLSVSEISGERNLGIITSPAHESFLSIPTGYPVIFDWPRFPAKASNASRLFRAPEANRVKEEILFEGGSRFKISMTYTHERTKGLIQTIRSSQSWQVGQPWWNSASAESEFVVNNEKSSDWSIRGKLL